MRKILLFLFVIGLGSMVTFGVMMPELNLILMDVLVIEGKADVTGTFECECVPMPDPTNPDTNGDTIPDCGPSNFSCDPEVCDADDFGTVSSPGPYFESAAICDYIPLP